MLGAMYQLQAFLSNFILFLLVVSSSALLPASKSGVI